MERLFPIFRKKITALPIVHTFCLFDISIIFYISLWIYISFSANALVVILQKKKSLPFIYAKDLLKFVWINALSYLTQVYPKNNTCCEYRY